MAVNCSNIALRRPCHVLPSKSSVLSRNSFSSSFAFHCNLTTPSFSASLSPKNLNLLTFAPKPRLRKLDNTVRASSSSMEATSLEATEPIKVFDSEGNFSDQFPASSGVYAIYDSEGTLQFLGLARRLSASIEVHANSLPNLCSTVKVVQVEAKTRESLTNAWKVWMEEHLKLTGKLPPGNEKGNTTWTEKRVRRAKPDIRLTPGGNKELTVPISELVDRVVKEFKVVAFIKGTRTAPQCGFSHRVLTILNEQKVDYETLNVLDEDSNPGLREAIKQYSQWPTIPQLYVKGEFVGGADILDEMESSGELKKLFKF